MRLAIDNKSGQFLRWAGSKRKLLPKLRAFWSNDFKRYIEPFMGSACLFFSIVPEKALLGDLNQELVNCFIAVRDHPLAVSNALSNIPIGEKRYYRVRSQKLSPTATIKRSARFIYLNRFCFNGLYRTNKTGQFNVPFGGYSTGNLPTYSELKKASKALKKADIYCADFEELILSSRSGDFVYLDPPYVLSTRRIFTEYSPNSFSFDDISRLTSALKKLDKKGAAFLLSYADCSEARELAKYWGGKRSIVHRNISGFAANRRNASEYLISNLEIPAWNTEN